MPDKPTNFENEFVDRQEFERLKKLHEEEAKKMKEEEKKKLKELHHMHCPKCGHKMIEITFKDVQIDECPECKGIYFDNGELDQILKADAGLRGKIYGIFK